MNPSPTVASATERSTAPTEARAFAVLQVASAANLAAFYVRRGNLRAAKRKALVLLKSLQALEVTP